jgi:hypothetical protein
MMTAFHTMTAFRGITRWNIAMRQVILMTTSDIRRSTSQLINLRNQSSSKEPSLPDCLNADGFAWIGICDRNEISDSQAICWLEHAAFLSLLIANAVSQSPTACAGAQPTSSPRFTRRVALLSGLEWVETRAHNHITFCEWVGETHKY